MIKKKETNKRGALLIELFLSIIILVSLTTGSLSLLFPAIKSAEIGRERLKAKWLMWEQEEAIRQVRNESWNYLTAGTYYASYNPTTIPPTTYQGWQLIPGVGTKQGFNEYLTITIPFRTSSNQLDDSVGVQETNMRKIVYHITWTSFGISQSFSLTSYLSNWQPF